jgi:hypothetical protein
MEWNLIILSLAAQGFAGLQWKYWCLLLEEENYGTRHVKEILGISSNLLINVFIMRRFGLSVNGLEFSLILILLISFQGRVLFIWIVVSLF